MSNSTDPHVAKLETGYARCAEITREHGTTYYWGVRLLPAARRRHVHAIYSLARLADDIVDEASNASDAETACALDEFETRFHQAVETGDSEDPILAAVATTVRACDIPQDRFDRFFGAMRSDLTQSRYETWNDLLGYMDGSAAVIGEMMLPVLRPGPDAVDAARALGLAFQLTNFLRDVGEDLDRGRVYLPQEDLRRFGADPADRRTSPQWRDLMRFEIERNRRLYREADEGLAALPPSSRRCVATARVLYARILDRIEAAGYDVFSARVRVPTRQKLALAGRMLTSRDPARVVAKDRAAQRPTGWHSDDQVVLLDTQGHAVGALAKSAAHHDATPLHLGFSCYVVDDGGRLLVTTRALDKPSFPGVVTNTVCGHPQPGERPEDAVRRRARQELGLELGEVRAVLPDFRYRAAMGAIVEHELCPVYLARAASTEPAPDPSEVASAHWEPWHSFAAQVLRGRAVSPWCSAQVRRLVALGPDPLAWPAASPAGLPPAARFADPGTA